MLKYIAHSSKSYFLLCAATILFDGVETFVSLYFIQWIYGAIESEYELSRIIGVIALAVSTLFFVYFFEKYLQKVIRPKIISKISVHIYTNMLEKIPEIDLQCYENSSFYDQYTRALSETEGRAFAVVNTIIDFLAAIVNVGIVVTFVAVLDPIFLIFGIVATLSIFLPGFINAKLNYRERMDKTIYKIQTSQRNVK